MMRHPIRLIDINPLLVAAAPFVRYLRKPKKPLQQNIQAKDELTVQGHKLMCLTWASPGQYFTIVSVQADPVLARRLLWLGLFEGSTWEVLHRRINGTVTLRDAKQSLTLKVEMASCIWGQQSTSLG